MPKPCFSHPISRLAALLALALFLAGLGPTARVAAAPLPKGDRILTINVTEAADGDYDAAFRLALDAGMEEAGLTFHWEDLEPEAGRYVDDFPTIANVYFPTLQTPLHLAVSPISTNVDVRPADLQALPFDDPLVIDRFNLLLDHIFALMPDVAFGSILIGLEVDAYLGDDVARWSAFNRFFAETSAHMRALRPGVTVGVETLVGGRFELPAKLFRGIDAESDLIGLSRYPIGVDFGALPPAAIEDEIDRVLALLPADKPVHFNQIGYPSSDLLGSSEAAQADFIRHAFAAWDRHADRISRMEFTWLHDVSPEAVAGFEDFYGFADPRFAAFLGSIGLRTHDGVDKAAFVALKEEAAARGWTPEARAEGSGHGG